METSAKHAREYIVFGFQDEAKADYVASQLRALTPDTSLCVVPRCHICGSVDAVRTEQADLCSKGHPVSVPRADLEKVNQALEMFVRWYSIDGSGLNRDMTIAAARAALAMLERVAK